LNELVGWREFGQQSRRARGAPVSANRHQDAAEAAFYMLGQPDVWASASARARPASITCADRPDIGAMPRTCSSSGRTSGNSATNTASHAGETGGFTIRLPSHRATRA